MDKAGLRQALAAFLGAERFDKFVSQARGRDRMALWAEMAWRQFVEAHPEWAVSEKQLREALRICSLHRTELLSEPVVVPNLESEEAMWFFATPGIHLPTVTEPGQRPRFVLYSGSVYAGASCPWAWPTEDIQWTEDCPFPPVHTTNSYCPDCRRIYATLPPVRPPVIDWDRVRERIKQCQAAGAGK
jgi:hypothetical protein